VDIDEICALSLSAVAERIAQRALSPVAITEATLARIARLDPHLNAYITVMGDEARHAAHEAEAEIARGQYRGPLHGVPISLKDLFATKGVRLTAGSRILANYVADKDAAAVRRLRAAGAIVIGKTNMLEFAYGEVCDAYGPSRNPWNTAYGTSGSSSGSAAAVAAGLCYGSLGSDTGGSIRLPAAYCGIVGLKPTYDLVSRAGAVPLSWSFDHIGPMTRSVRDCALLLDTIAEVDNAGTPGYAESLPMLPRDVTVGFVAPLEGDGVTPEVWTHIAAANETVRAMGFKTKAVALPHIDQAIRVLLAMRYAEASNYHLPWLRARASEYSPMTRERLELGALLPATVYLRAMRVRGALADSYRALLESVDILAMPTAPAPANRLDVQSPQPSADRGDPVASLIRFTGPFNVTGLPALSMPCGLSSDGLPIGIQFVSRPFADRLVLQFADAFERAVAWDVRRPPGNSLVV
jgi:aspartyl-tRNA(Asn)/glutamyl-tRNA(Gln) amidotransferase subunit A